jgi:hypothetical protein
MRIGFSAFWLQKAGNSSDEYEDAFAPSVVPAAADCPEFRCAIADGATETSFSGLWAQILVDAFVSQRLAHVKPEAVDALSAHWRAAIDSRHKPLPWYALEKLERGAFSSLLGLTIRADGNWRALCVGDSCLFHVRPQQAIRAFPYHLPDQFNNHPALISTRLDASVAARTARGKWKNGDYFLLMTDALAHFFLSQRRLRVRLAADGLDQAGFEQVVANARGERICRNDDVTLVKIVPVFGEGQGGLAESQ